MSSLDRMREFVRSLHETSERSHFQDRMFYVGSKPFASCGEKGVVVQLEPEHAAELIHREPQHFQAYPMAKHCVQFDLEKVGMWKELVRESYDLVVAKLPAAKKKPAAPRKKARKR